MWGGRRRFSSDTPCREQPARLCHLSRAAQGHGPSSSVFDWASGRHRVSQPVAGSFWESLL